MRIRLPTQPGFSSALNGKPHMQAMALKCEQHARPSISTQGSCEREESHCLLQVAGVTGKVQVDGGDDEGISTEAQGAAILAAFGVARRNEVRSC